MKFIILAIAMTFCVNACFSDSRFNYVKDIEYFKQKIAEKHIDPFNKVSEDEFNADIDALKAKSVAVKDFEFIFEMMKIVRKIGDGHTAVHFQSETNLRELPIDFGFTAGKFWVIGATEEHANLIGSELLSIEGKNIGIVSDRISTIVQFVENEYSEKQRIAQYITYVDLLAALDIITDQGSSTIRLIKDGKESLVTLGSTNKSKNGLRNSFHSKITKVTDAGIDGLWFGSVNDTDAVYIDFSTYPSSDQMERFGKKLLSYIRNKNIKKIAIDLRGNWGGNFYIGLRLAYYLNLADSVDWKHGVYVMVDNHTFSAATINAAQYAQLLNAKVLGTPTGSNLNGYQDMGTFVLPSTNLTISYSKRKFVLSQAADQPLFPDVELTPDMPIFTNHRDKVLEYFINEVSSADDTI